MDSTVAVQTNGWGSSFHTARNSVIAFSKSSTLWNDDKGGEWLKRNARKMDDQNELRDHALTSLT
jgi:hypothetical protein